MPPPLSDPFDALGLPDTATPTQVKAAWRIKAGRAHPDHGGTAEEFNRIQALYRRALRIAENAPCPDCRGTGKIGSGNGFVSTLLRCMTCKGTGRRN